MSMPKQGCEKRQGIGRGCWTRKTQSQSPIGRNESKNSGSSTERCQSVESQINERRNDRKDQASPVTNEKASVTKQRVRNKRPEIQVYVPRAKRQQQTLEASQEQRQEKSLEPVDTMLLPHTKQRSDSDYSCSSSVDNSSRCTGNFPLNSDVERSGTTPSSNIQDPHKNRIPVNPGKYKEPDNNDNKISSPSATPQINLSPAKPKSKKIKMTMKSDLDNSIERDKCLSTSTSKSGYQHNESRIENIGSPTDKNQSAQFRVENIKSPTDKNQPVESGVDIIKSQTDKAFVACSVTGSQLIDESVVGTTSTNDNSQNQNKQKSSNRINVQNTDVITNDENCSQNSECCLDNIDVEASDINNVQLPPSIEHPLHPHLPETLVLHGCDNTPPHHQLQSCDIIQRPEVQESCTIDSLDQERVDALEPSLIVNASDSGDIIELNTENNSETNMFSDNISPVISAIDSLPQSVKKTPRTPQSKDSLDFVGSSMKATSDASLLHISTREVITLKEDQKCIEITDTIKDKNNEETEDKRSLSDKNNKLEMSVDETSRSCIDKLIEDVPASGLETMNSAKTDTNLTCDEDNGDEDGDDSWDKIFDDNGDCLDPQMMDELSATVGKVTIQKTKINYYDYQPKDPDLDLEEYGHIIEIYEFPKEYLTRDLITSFQSFMSRGFDIKWVDDTHALGIFSSAVAAQEALSLNYLGIKVRAISDACKQSKQKAKRCSEFMQPYKARPQTTSMAARRLVTGALGLTSNLTKEKRDQERQKLREARDKKKRDKKQKDDIWDGSIGHCAMDAE